MINKLKISILALSSVFLMSFSAVPVLAAAAGPDVQGSLCSGAQNLTLSGTATCPTGQSSSFDNVLTTIINVFSVIVGIVAVIMIIIGGFRYITSSGNPEGAKTARNTILYAIIGLVVVALAQIIVKFVLNKAINPTS